MSSTYNVLLVEDNETERYLFRHVCESSLFNRSIYEVSDGDEAMDFLFKRNQYTDAPTPDVVVLDLNLPRVPGHEVLRRMKADENLRVIPVIVLTVSNNSDDVNECYALGANAFVRKPEDLQLFCDAVHRIEKFWLDVAILPFKHEQKASAQRVISSIPKPEA